MKKRMWHWNVLFIVGLAVSVSGVAMQSLPWAFVVGGVCAVGIAVVGGLID